MSTFRVKNIIQFHFTKGKKINATQKGKRHTLFILEPHFVVHMHGNLVYNRDSIAMKYNCIKRAAGTTGICR